MGVRLRPGTVQSHRASSWAIAIGQIGLLGGIGINAILQDPASTSKDSSNVQGFYQTVGSNARPVKR